MMHSFGCKQESAHVCLGCGARVCGCHGTARGQCPVCYRGFLSGFYRPLACGYKGCTSHAVASVPRVERACLAHAKARGGYAPPLDARTLGDATPGAPLTPYSAQLFARHPELINERD